MVAVTKLRLLFGSLLLRGVRNVFRRYFAEVGRGQRQWARTAPTDGCTWSWPNSYRRYEVISFPHLFLLLLFSPAGPPDQISRIGTGRGGASRRFNLAWRIYSRPGILLEHFFDTLSCEIFLYFLGRLRPLALPRPRLVELSLGFLLYVSAGLVFPCPFLCLVWVRFLRRIIKPLHGTLYLPALAVSPVNLLAPYQEPSWLMYLLGTASTILYRCDGAH